MTVVVSSLTFLLWKGLFAPGQTSHPGSGCVARSHAPERAPQAGRAPERSASPTFAPSPPRPAQAEPHSPDELWRHTTRLVAERADVVLTETALPARALQDLEHELGSTTRIEPRADGAGIEIKKLHPESLARAAGFQEGDVITAVNGFALGKPDAVLEAYTSVRRERSAVVEIRRGERRVLLRLRLLHGGRAMH